MKILHILPDIHTGGSQKLCIDLCNELAKNPTNEVILCTVDKVTKQQNIMLEKISPKVKFFSLNKTGKNPIIFLKIIKMIFTIKPDIVHTHTRAQIFAALGIILKNIPNIHTIHSMADKEMGQKRLKIHKFLYKYFNFTPISISPTVLQSTKNLYGEKFDVRIDNGTKAIDITPKYNETKQFIQKLKKDKNSKIFISIGRFYAVKNQELLIDSFEKLLDDGFDAHLIILGSLDVVPSYAQICQDKIKTPSNIHLLGEKENIVDYLVQADALCFTSLFEGFPIAIIEAMSIGIPTISTPVGGVPDIVIPEKTGYLSKDMSVKSYKELFIQMINDTQLNKKYIMEYYNKHYTIEKCAYKYMMLYKEKTYAYTPTPKVLSNL